MKIGGREQFAARRAIRLWRSLSRSIHRARSAGRMATSCLRPLSESTSSSSPQAGGASSTESRMTSGIVSCGPKASNTLFKKRRRPSEIRDKDSDLSRGSQRRRRRDESLGAATGADRRPKPRRGAERNASGAGRGEEEILAHRVVTRDQAETVANPRRRIGQCFAYFTNERKLFASAHERHRRGNIDDRIEIHGTTLFESANVNFLEWIAQARANVYAPCVGMAQERRLVAKHAEPAHFARRMRTDVIRSKAPARTIEDVGWAFHGAGVASKTARHRRFTGSSPRKA